MVDQLFAMKTYSTRCCHVIELAGELDMSTAPQVQDQLASYLVMPEHLLVDITGLVFMDSTGLKVLLEAHRLVEGRMSLVGPTPQVQRLLELAGTANVLHVSPDRATARSHLHTAA